MFTINDKCSMKVIRLTRGDTAEISTTPQDNSKATVQLSENDCVLFTVGSPSGNIYIKRVLTSSDADENGDLIFKLSPADTKDMQPFCYMYSFAYMPNKGEDVYTYDIGVFDLMPAVSTVDEIEVDNERI